MNAQLEYRAYRIGDDGHFARCHQFIAPNDDDALEHARQFVNGYDVELWNGGRIVAKFKKRCSDPV